MYIAVADQLDLTSVHTNVHTQVYTHTCTHTHITHHTHIDFTERGLFPWQKRPISVAREAYFKDLAEEELVGGGVVFFNLPQILKSVSALAYLPYKVTTKRTFEK